MRYGNKVWEKLKSEGIRRKKIREREGEKLKSEWELLMIEVFGILKLRMIFF